MAASLSDITAATPAPEAGSITNCQNKTNRDKIYFTSHKLIDHTSDFI